MSKLFISLVISYIKGVRPTGSITCDIIFHTSNIVLRLNDYMKHKLFMVLLRQHHELQVFHEIKRSGSHYCQAINTVQYSRRIGSVFRVWQLIGWLKGVCSLANPKIQQPTISCTLIQQLLFLCYMCLYTIDVYSLKMTRRGSKHVWVVIF
jgi:hypothetical protein